MSRDPAEIIASAALLSALFTSASILALTIVGGLFTPGYSHISQFISELGARGAVHESVIRYGGFLPAGLSLVVYCIAAYLSLPRSRSATFSIIGIAAYAVGYIVAAFLPCDAGCRPRHPSSSQLIHNAVGLVGYVAAPVFLYTLARNARGWSGASFLVSWGYFSAVLALAGLLTLSSDSPLAGLSQRAIELAVLSWVVASALCIRARVRGGAA